MQNAKYFQLRILFSTPGIDPDMQRFQAVREESYNCTATGGANRNIFCKILTDVTQHYADYFQHFIISDTKNQTAFDKRCEPLSSSQTHFLLDT